MIINSKTTKALIKNSIGWKTKRKIVAFSIDDYGNVRVNSKKSRDQMNNEGLKVTNRFDAYDSLENTQDLEMLFETLTSVKDINGNHPVFTAFSVPSNIDFNKVIESNFSEFHSELLPETYKKLELEQSSRYKGAWKLWNEGIENKLLIPQYHGREHLNLKVFKEKLKSKDPNIISSIKNKSYASIGKSGYSSISITGAYEFWDFNENYDLAEIISEGIDLFEQVFKKKPVHFNPPGGREHPILHKTLHQNGIKFIDQVRFQKVHKGHGHYKKTFNYTGKKNPFGQLICVRNCVFEPNDHRGFDWVNYTMKEIEAAFALKKPAFISSHRVNFSGNIQESNRSTSLKSLKELLHKIAHKWPEVEFMSANEVMDLITRKAN